MCSCRRDGVTLAVAATWRPCRHMLAPPTRPGARPPARSAAARHPRQRADPPREGAPWRLRRDAACSRRPEATRADRRQSPRSSDRRRCCPRPGRAHSRCRCGPTTLESSSSCRASITCRRVWPPRPSAGCSTSSKAGARRRSALRRRGSTAHRLCLDAMVASYDGTRLLRATTDANVETRDEALALAREVAASVARAWARTRSWRTAGDSWYRRPASRSRSSHDRRAVRSSS